MEQLYEFKIAEALHSFWPQGCNLSGNPHLTDNEQSRIDHVDCCLPLLGCDEEDQSRGISIIDYMLNTYISQFQVYISTHLKNDRMRSNVIVDCYRAWGDFSEHDQHARRQLPPPSFRSVVNLSIRQIVPTLTLQVCCQQIVSPTDRPTMDFRVCHQDITPKECHRVSTTTNMIEHPQIIPTTTPTIPTVKITERTLPSRNTYNSTEHQHTLAPSITHTTQQLPTTGRPTPSLNTCPPCSFFPTFPITNLINQRICLTNMSLLLL